MRFTRKEKMWIKVEKRIESERRYQLQHGDKPGGPELRGETEQEQKKEIPMVFTVQREEGTFAGVRYLQ